MPKSKTESWVDIPPESLRIKDDFWDEPGKDIVRQIHARLKAGGMPYDDPCHTHTAPQFGSRVVYLDDFSLSTALLKAKRFSPCPCCTPNNRKFGRGKIAHFPDEGVIRLLGPDCFKSLNPDGHDAAVRELRIRKQRERDVNFLLQHHGNLLKARADLIVAQQAAEAIDKFGAALRYRIYDLLGLPLWNQVRHGSLQVWERANEADLRTGEIKEIDRKRVYANLAGYRILNPDLKSLEFRLRQPLWALPCWTASAIGIPL